VPNFSATSTGEGNASTSDADVRALFQDICAKLQNACWALPTGVVGPACLVATVQSAVLAQITEVTTGLDHLEIAV
jgi:hypothetical protein